MRSSLLPTISVAVLLSALSALGGVPTDLIVAPDAEHPVFVEADRLLEVHAALRLPLTPPPGVQQTAAVRGWKIILTAENAWNLDKTPAVLRYELPVMRIRPLKDDAYRILTEPPPWLPEGRYNVTVTGPGFGAAAPKAVVVPGASEGKEPLFATVSATSPEQTFLIPDEKIDANRPRFLRVVLPKSVAGIAMTRNGAHLYPESIAFDDLPNTGARVLTFALPNRNSQNPAKTEDGPMRLQWSVVHDPQCDGRIRISDTVKNDAMAYRDITFHATYAPKTILWDFGDGRFGVGASVRRRWMLTNEAKITAWAFDDNGRVCEDETVVRLNELARNNGCSCTAVGVPPESCCSSLLKTFFFLFHAAFGE